MASGISAHPYVQAFSPIMLILLSIVVALPPLAIHVCAHPLTYLVSAVPVRERVSKLQSKFFFYAWRFLGPMLEPRHTPNKVPLLAKAKGIVLEIGPGIGGNIKYYTSQATRLVLVEPNVDMHPAIRKSANEAGYWEGDGSLLILGCGGAISDERALKLAGIGPSSIDTVVSIHVLCGIPNPAQAIEMYRRLLKPGGLLLFYEHVRSEEPFSARCQASYTRAFWSHIFAGCCLDRPTGAYIMAGPEAAQGKELVTGKELAYGVDGIDPRVHERWSDYQLDTPSEQAQYTLLPQLLGWAVKA